MNRRIVAIIVICFVSIVVIAGLAGCFTVNPMEKTDIAIPEEFRKTIAMLDNVRGYRMPYFGGYDMDDKQVVLLSENSNKAVVWNVDTSGKSKFVDKSILPDEFTYSFFSKGTFNGIDTIFMMQQSDAQETFSILIHEGYHFYGQERLMDIHVTHQIPRGTAYPENIEARYLMRAADERLREKIEGTNEDGDREALFFFLQMVEKYSRDVEGNLSTALSEGTANFVEHLFLAVAKNPEIKNDKNAVAKAAYSENKVKMGFVDLNKSYEYYQVASLPLYYLVVQNRDTLLERIFEGKHPLSLLQYVVSPKESPEITYLKRQVANYVEKKNEMAESHIKAYQEKQNDEYYTLVKLSLFLFTNAVSFEEFINFRVGAEYRVLNLGTRVYAKTKTGSIDVRGENTIGSFEEEFFLVYVPTESIHESNGKLNIDSGTVVIKNVNFTIENGAYIINE